MDKITKKSLPTVRIIKYKKKHSIIYITPICQIIVDYLQYEEAMVVYFWLRCSEPVRPCIDISNITEREYLKPRAIPWPKFNNIEKLYIPNIGVEITNKILFQLIFI